MLTDCCWSFISERRTGENKWQKKTERVYDELFYSKNNISI